MIDLTRDLTKHPTRYLTRDRTKLLIFGFFIVYFGGPRKNESAALSPGFGADGLQMMQELLPIQGDPVIPYPPLRRGGGRG